MLPNEDYKEILQLIPTRCAAKVFDNVQQEVQPIEVKTESEVKG